MKIDLSHFVKFAELRSVRFLKNFAVLSACLQAGVSFAADSQRSVATLQDELGIGAFAHENWKALFALAGALGILGLLGYAYLRKSWRVKRDLRRQRQLSPGQTIVALGLTDGTRKPWIYSETAAPPANGHWLKSPAARETCGTLLVEGNTEVDELYVDERLVGMAPAKLRLRQGRYSVEVRRAGFRSYRRQISVIAGAEVTLRAVFEKEPSSEPTPWNTDEASLRSRTQSKA